MRANCFPGHNPQEGIGMHPTGNVGVQTQGPGYFGGLNFTGHATAPGVVRGFACQGFNAGDHASARSVMSCACGMQARVGGVQSFDIASK